MPFSAGCHATNHLLQRCTPSVLILFELPAQTIFSGKRSAHSVCCSKNKRPITNAFTECTNVFWLYFREALLAEMGVAIREDGGTLGVFSPKKVWQTGWERTVSTFPLVVKHILPPSLHFTSLSFSMRTLPGVFFLYHSVFLSTSYLLPSHTQLSDEGPFDKPFDCFATKKVCLTK